MIGHRRGRHPARPRGAVAHDRPAGPVVHVGATEHSPPLAAIMPATGELRPAGLVDDVNDLVVEADEYRADRAARHPDVVDDELAAIDEALEVFDRRMTALLAAWTAGFDPMFCYRLAAGADDTGEFPIIRVVDMRRARRPDVDDGRPR